MNGDRARRALDLLALAGKLIELSAADFDGGIHGRNLLDRASEAAQNGLQLFTRDRNRLLAERFAAGVLCIGDKAEAETCDVFLFCRLHEFSRARRASDKNGQYAGRHRVKRPTVADAALMKYTAQLCRHVLTGPAGGLVYD